MKQEGKQAILEASPPLETERRKRAERCGPARKRKGKGLRREEAHLPDVLLSSQKPLQLHEDLAHRHGAGHTTTSQCGEGSQLNAFHRESVHSVATAATAASASSTGPYPTAVAEVLRRLRRAESRAVYNDA